MSYLVRLLITYPLHHNLFMLYAGQTNVMLMLMLMAQGGGLSSLSNHHYTVEMASYNAPRDELKQYKLLEDRKLLDRKIERRKNVINEGGLRYFCREFYL